MVHEQQPDTERFHWWSVFLVVTVSSTQKNLDLIFIFVVAEGESKSQHVLGVYSTAGSYQQLLNFYFKEMKWGRKSFGILDMRI